MKKIIFMVFAIILVSSFVYAEETNFTEAKKLIDSGVGCDNLTEEQLEIMGDYYMEQMHPGEAHELMDRMMGGEGSESLKQVHINIARRLYCNENIYIGYGMMGYGGMMNRMWGNSFVGPGMMGNYGYGSGYWNFFTFLYAALLLGLLVLIISWIIKLLKKSFKRK